ncbi:hypothetical protein CROQUDRAFT_104434 [Cronartium quercuum f. sp. fusiforme G11]|uniref:Carboxylesterase type B domain-containing protein n=1 Tax=Cronartium quercuum f. sp. fusiforme G11 TaxID=708437 RepID=A0A9P6NND1_9BASI|nr:hypothetical protein CROQUDRAFT_104434 [Cronartium quercuum f. sp. fusiforme G11]
MKKVIYSWIFIVCFYVISEVNSSHISSEHLEGLGTVTEKASTIGNIFERHSNNSEKVRLRLSYGTFIGTRFRGYERFTGIPYAEPPVGNLRLRNPIPPKGYYHDLNVQKQPPSCVQQAPTSGSGFWATLFTNAMYSVRQFFIPLESGVEDCLTLDVYRPSGLSRRAKLPVMFFIYGGAFVFGGTYTYPGKELVLKSMQLGKPIIYVTANYRLSAFGFLGGKEVGEAGVGNLGLKDQRLALEWVQRHIHKIGGDPKKVTIFGQSAGAMSVSYHLMINQGKLNGLFRAAICESGTALPTQHLSKGAGQEAYDIISREVGCSATNDTLACIRKVEFETLVKALNKLEGILSLNFYPPNFTPFIDGKFISETPRSAFANGRFAKVPMITGNQDDEGTAIGFGQISLITPARFEKYLRKLMNNATEAQLKTTFRLYPEDVTKGSPFNTGYDNAITPVYKRYSALVGDFIFQCLRRKFSRLAQSQMPLWGYLDTGYKRTPILGSFHTSELLAVFGFVKSLRSHDYQSRWITFAYDLDPNVPGLPHWSRYGKGKGQLMRFGPHGSQRMCPDDYREEAIGFFADNEGYLVV